MKVQYLMIAKFLKNKIHSGILNKNLSKDQWVIKKQ